MASFSEFPPKPVHIGRVDYYPNREIEPKSVPSSQKEKIAKINAIYTNRIQELQRSGFFQTRFGIKDEQIERDVEAIDIHERQITVIFRNNSYSTVELDEASEEFAGEEGENPDIIANIEMLDKIEAIYEEALHPPPPLRARAFSHPVVWHPVAAEYEEDGRSTPWEDAISDITEDETLTDAIEATVALREELASTQRALAATETKLRAISSEEKLTELREEGSEARGKLAAATPEKERGTPSSEEALKKISFLEAELAAKEGLIKAKEVEFARTKETLLATQQTLKEDLARIEEALNKAVHTKDAAILEAKESAEDRFKETIAGLQEANRNKELAIAHIQQRSYEESQEMAAAYLKELQTLKDTHEAALTSVAAGFIEALNAISSEKEATLEDAEATQEERDTNQELHQHALESLRQQLAEREIAYASAIAGLQNAHTEELEELNTANQKLLQALRLDLEKIKKQLIDVKVEQARFQDTFNEALGTVLKEAETRIARQKALIATERPAVSDIAVDTVDLIDTTNALKKAEKADFNAELEALVEAELLIAYQTVQQVQQALDMLQREAESKEALSQEAAEALHTQITTLQRQLKEAEDAKVFHDSLLQRTSLEKEAAILEKDAAKKELMNFKFIHLLLKVRSNLLTKELASKNDEIVRLKEELAAYKTGAASKEALDSQIAKLTQEAQALEAAKVSINEEIAEKNRQQQLLQISYQSLESALTKLSERKASLDEAIEALEKKKASYESKHHPDKITELENEITKQKEALSSAQSDLGSALQFKEALTQLIKAYSGSAEDRDSSYENLMRELANLLDNLKREKDKVTPLTEALEALKKSFEDALKEKTKLVAQFQAAEQTACAIEKRLALKEDSHAKETAALRTLLETSDAKVQSLSTDLNSMRESARLITSQLKALQADMRAQAQTLLDAEASQQRLVAGKQAEIDDLKEKIPALLANIQTLEAANGENVYLKEELERSKNLLERMQTQINDLTTQNEQLSDKLKATRATVRVLEELLAKPSIGLDDYEKLITANTTLLEETGRLKLALRDKEDEVETFRASIASLQARLAELEGVKDSHAKQAAEALATLRAAHEEEKRALLDQLQNSQDKTLSVTAELEGLKATTREVAEDLTKMHKIAQDDLLKRLEELQERQKALLSKKEKEFEDLEKQLPSLQADIEALERALADSGIENRTIKQQLAEAQETLALTQRSLEEALRTNALLSDQIESSSAEIVSMRSALAKMISEQDFDALQKQNASLLQLIAKLQETLVIKEGEERAVISIFTSLKAQFISMAETFEAAETLKALGNTDPAEALSLAIETFTRELSFKLQSSPAETLGEKASLEKAQEEITSLRILAHSAAKELNDLRIGRGREKISVESQYGSIIAEKEEEIASLTHKIHLQELQAASDKSLLAEEIAKYKALAESLKSELGHIRDQISPLKLINSSLLSQKTELERKLNELQALQAAQASTVARQASIIAALQEEMVPIRGNLESLHHRLTGKKAPDKTEDLIVEINGAIDVLARAKDGEISRLERDFSLLNASYKTLQTNIDKALSAKRTSEAQVAELRLQLRSTTSSLDKTNGELKTLTDKIDALYGKYHSRIARMLSIAAMSSPLDKLRAIERFIDEKLTEIEKLSVVAERGKEAEKRLEFASREISSLRAKLEGSSKGGSKPIDSSTLNPIELAKASVRSVTNPFAAVKVPSTSPITAVAPPVPDMEAFLAKFAELEARNASLAAKIKEAEAFADSLNRQNFELQHLLEASERSKAALAGNLDHTSASLEEEKANNRRLQTELDSLKIHLDGLHARALATGDQSAAIKEHEDTITTLKGRIRALEDLLATKAKVDPATKREIEHLRARVLEAESKLIKVNSESSFNEWFTLKYLRGSSEESSLKGLEGFEAFFKNLCKIGQLTTYVKDNPMLFSRIIKKEKEALLRILSGGPAGIDEFLMPMGKMAAAKAAGVVESSGVLNKPKVLDRVSKCAEFERIIDQILMKKDDLSDLAILLPSLNLSELCQGIVTVHNNLGKLSRNIHRSEIIVGASYEILNDLIEALKDALA